MDGGCGRPSTVSEGAAVDLRTASRSCRRTSQPRGRSRSYVLFGKPVVLCEGDCELSNTGWRTWAGAWLLARHFELNVGAALVPLSVAPCDDAPSLTISTRRSVLDLSCGTGLAGIALAKAGYDVVLSDLEVNVPTIRANVSRNMAEMAIVEGREISTVARQNFATAHMFGPDVDGVLGSTSTSGASVCGYVWGQPLPDEMRRSFDVVVCGDLLYHVWSDRLQPEFLATLQDLYRRKRSDDFEFLFGFQVRSTRQEEQILGAAARRLGLVREELPVEELLTVSGGTSPPGSPVVEGVKYRVVRLRPRRQGEAEDGTDVAS